MSKEKEKQPSRNSGMEEKKEPVRNPELETVPGSAPKTEKIPAAETVSSAEKIIEGLRKQLAETENRRLFALAEMDNQRKRAAKERETLRIRVEQETLMPFLQVFDHFSMGIRAAKESKDPKDAKSVESLLKGMEIVQAEFEKAFSELGIEKIDDVGKEFDPNFHEAMMQEASDTVPAGRIIKQWCFGFRSGDRLIKPAMVIVSSGKPASAAAKEAAPDKD